MAFTLLASGYGGVIETLSLDLSASPSLTKTSSTPAGNAPTWLTLSSKGVVYTGDEFSEPDGELHAFTVDKDGKLSPLNSTKSGAGPVHFVLSPDGKNLYSANYGSGSLTAVAVNADGSFEDKAPVTFNFTGTGPNAARQEMPHIHGVYVDPTGQYLLATDLGGDQLKVYKINGSQLDALPSISLPAGNGPRHLVMSPPSASSSQTLLYLIEELSSTIAVFEILYPTTPEGPLSLRAIQKDVSTLPPDSKSTPGAWDAAEVALSADGRYLYASNRAPLDPHPDSDTLTIFELNGEGGVVSGATPTYLSLGGRGPRHFSLSPKKDGVPQGKYVAVGLQRTNEVVVYETNGKDFTEIARAKDVKEPTCVIWL
ncbi:hypothetical protein JCM10207_004451 [Rhodosporidiobolus poonsookiae]